MDERLKSASERAKVAELPLAFPGKVLADAQGGRLFIADSNHNRIVITKLDGTLIATVGTGARGAADGAFDRATFNRPQGLALDVGQNGDEGTLYVADTENHLVRKVDLKSRTVTTIAGTGRQSHGNPSEESATPARNAALNSPSDLQLVSRRLYIAMAGSHQIWLLNLKTNTISVFAGSGREAHADGARQTAAFAQPSGLTGDGTTLYVADAESSDIRSVDLARGAKPSADDEPKLDADAEGNTILPAPQGEISPPGEDEMKAVAVVKPTPTTAPQVSTLAGGGLSGPGDEDGAGNAVRFQHPRGVLYVEGYGIFIADTDNHQIKLLDPLTRAVKTVAGTGQPGQVDGDHASFYEPGGLSYADGKLYIADTNNHAIRVVDPATGKTSTLTLLGLAPPAASPSSSDAKSSRKER